MWTRVLTLGRRLGGALALALCAFAAVSTTSVEAAASPSGSGASSLSDTGSEVGFRTGYGIPIGRATAAPGDELRRVIAGQVLLWLEAGYRVLPRLQVGGYFAYGFGFAGDAVEAACTPGERCGVNDLRLGVGAQYHFAPRRIDPWLGVGVGYEWLGYSRGGVRPGLDLKVHGFELVHWSGGLDFPLGPGFGLGPFAELTLAKYRTVSNSCRSELICANSWTLDIEPTSFHEWLFLGLRGTVVID